MALLPLSELDKYIRWLDSERRGKLSALARTLRMSSQGLFFKALGKNSQLIDSCATDILLVQPSKKSQELGRKNHLIEKIKESGLTIKEIVLKKNNEYARSYFSPPEEGVPLRYYAIAGYAKYLVEKYKPRVVLTERYDETFSYFIRKYLDGTGALVHIAHSIPTEDSKLFSFNYCDYYLLFGASSIEKMIKKNVRFGTSKACAVGSYLVSADFFLSPSAPNNQILILSMGDWPRFNRLVEEHYSLLLEWISSRQDLNFIVKKHPNKTTSFWDQNSGLFSNLKVLPQSIGMKEALNGVSVVVNMHSNASIDAALLNRPIIPSDPLPYDDEFEVEKYFFNNCLNVQDLNNAYADICANYSYYLLQAQKFTRRHIENGCRSVDSLVNILKSISDGRNDFDYIVLNHKPPC